MTRLFTIALFVLIPLALAAQTDQSNLSYLPESVPLSSPVWKATSEFIPKSRFQAVMYSLLLPGMGEVYAGRTDRAIPAFIAEGVLWMGFAGFTAYSGWIEDDARSFAVTHAGVRTGGKSDQYFVDIGNFDNLDAYNSMKLLDRSLEELYPKDPAQGYSWNWDSRSNRTKYNDLRVLSDEMRNASRFVVAGLIINRIWSAIQASFLVRDYNAKGIAAIRVESRPLRYNGRPDGWALRVTCPF